MSLKRLKISGFKSFAKPTILEFLQGITAIVGPNGCGKSNIVDAFRWSMGEQSAKSIRGDKMVDVIFSGTASRKPLNLAEVTLTFSNENGQFPVAYQEVSICRRVYRSGESEFFINNNAVRLKDIDSLFWDTGLGKNAFCIFEQGKIEQVIINTPLERRAIFEEPAGIGRFKQRRKETLRKLEQVDDNLSRVQDILKEVSRQRKVFEQQAEVAKTYKNNRQALELLEKTSYVARWKALRGQKDKLEGKRKELEEELQALMQTAAVATDGLEALRTELQTTEEALKIKSEALHKCQSAMEVKRMENKGHAEKLEACKARLSKIASDLTALQTRREEGLKHIKDQGHSCVHLDKEWEEASKAHQAARAIYLAIQEKVQAMREAIRDEQTERMQALQQENLAKSALQEKQFHKERAEERKKSLDEEKLRLARQAEALKKEVVERRKALDETKKSSERHKKELQAVEAELAKLQETLTLLQEEAKGLIKTKTELEARRSVLIRLKEEMEGLSSGTKRLLKEAKDKKSPLYSKLQPLYECIDAMDKACAVALGSYHQTLVVGTLKDAASVVEFALKQGVTDFSLFCREHAKKEDLLAHFSEKTKVVGNAAEKWLGKRLEEGTILVDDEGGLLDRYGVFFKARTSQSSTFLRESEIKTVTSELELIEKQQKKIDEKLSDLQGKRTELSEKRAFFDKELRRQEMHLVEANFHFQKVLQDEQKAASEQTRLEKELNDLGPNLKQLISALKECESAQKTLSKQVEVVQKSLATKESALDAALEQMREKEAMAGEKEAFFRRKTEERQQWQSERLVFEAKDKENAREEKRLQEEKISEEARLKELEERLKGLTKEMGLTEKEAVSSEKEFAKQEGVVLKSREGVLKAEKRLLEHSEKVKKQEDARHKLDLAWMQETTQEEGLQQALQEQYGLALEDVEKEIGPFDETADVIEKRVRVLRKELDTAGDVNLASIDEFEKSREREEFLQQQVDDLTLSKDELLQIIEQLEGESRTLFAEVFQKIRTNFIKNFQLLFNGGEADLTFTDSKDILEAGIEISARPPGKQMRSITLLSGGEKCLTAMALLFAIFEVKPSAFCLLDEVDAPLDETNVDRLTNMLRQFTDRTQFIVITHNKRTMSVADRLFGISMEEKGVSTVLSLQLKQAEELALH